MQKTLYLLFAFLFFATSSYAQKAFEMLHYKGKFGRQTVQLDLADGYLMASEIKLGTESQTSRYLPEAAATGKLIFRPEKPTAPSSSFELTLVEGEKPGQSIKAIFMVGKEKNYLILKKVDTKG